MTHQGERNVPTPSTCKKCGNQIVWFRNGDKWIAVDAERIEVGDEQYEPRGYVKPENFPVCQTLESDYVRAIPEDEARHLDRLIGSQ